MNKTHEIFTKTMGEIGLVLEKETTPYNCDYVPSDFTRNTTNFANLARGKNSKTNIELLFEMINNRLNSLLTENNHDGKRYKIHLHVLTINASFKHSDSCKFPITEMLHCEVEDTRDKTKHNGAVGLNYSSYLRDFDFYNLSQSKSIIQNDFGVLHGLLYKLQFKSFWEEGPIEDDALIALSVSSNKFYKKSKFSHSVLGAEYIEQGEPSITSNYFLKMGLDARYFCPNGSNAPLAIYHTSGSLEEYSDIELASLISVMETFQKIYRPEIYNTNSMSPDLFKPSLSTKDYSQTKIDYDRVERVSLGENQAKTFNSSFLQPNKSLLDCMLRSYIDTRKTPQH